MAYTLKINGTSHSVDADPSTPLLWVLRDHLGMTGTKYGCGIAQCGCCTVHVEGVATRSCSVPVSAVQGKKITTIEGLANGDVLNKVQKAWIANEVPQCGYCVNGWIMRGAALLKSNPKATDAEMRAALSGLKCRCGTHMSILRAMKRAQKAMT